MRAVVLNCTLKRSPEASNTEALARVLVDEFEQAGIDTEVVRLVDLDIRPGITKVAAAANLIGVVRALAEQPLGPPPGD